MARKLTQFEQALLRQLQAKDSTTANARRVLKRSSCQFVLDYGWFYKPGPKRLELGKEGECYKNALALALGDPTLTYVEGFAVGEGGLRLHHAWVTDGTGEAIDVTWRTPGAVYAGVPFKGKFVGLLALKNKAMGSEIDDWEHDWPLLRELWDHPEKWQELKGKGLKKLA